MSGTREKANRAAVDALLAVEPVLVAIHSAHRAMGLPRTTVLTSGPTLPFRAYTGGQRAAVIGGASLTGGKGTIFGSILGLVLMQLVTNALTLYHISTFWHSFISYTILLIAVVLDQAQQLVSRRRTA